MIVAGFMTVCWRKQATIKQTSDAVRCGAVRYDQVRVPQQPESNSKKKVKARGVKKAACSVQCSAVEAADVILHVSHKPAHAELHAV